MRNTILTALILLSTLICKADEGMWIPMLLEKYTIEEMQQKGFRLTAEDVYNINRASLKDAVVGLGREGRPFQHFCTAELVSDEGLMFTNHHCALSMIQQHSTLDNNYIRNGFWAKTKAEELSNPGITASILVRMEDVTEKINNRLTSDMTDEQRADAIKKISKQLEEEAVAGSNLQADVRAYFNGNQFFMSVFKIFRDVRLVGAPPAAIGKFGGDTDNWSWPRHTGDFSLLRIYTDKNNEPASYSSDNVPYKPKQFFKISTKGVEEGDFTMVFGYPGTTTEYLPSFAIDRLLRFENPHKIAIRTAKLNIIDQAMESDELLRIKYSAKAAGVSNAWKKWQGESKGLLRFKTVENKQKLEKEFIEWSKSNPEYAGIVEKFAKLYKESEPYILPSVYAREAGLGGSEVIGFARTCHALLKNSKTSPNILKTAESFYKDYDVATDKKIMTELLKLYNSQLSDEWIPEEVKKANEKGDIEKYVDKMFAKSIFSDFNKLKIFSAKLHEKSLAKLEKDPIWKLAQSIYEFNSSKIATPLGKIQTQINSLNRMWLAGLMKMQTERNFYPDANSTLRIAYGKVGGYKPVDAVYYLHYTTLSGIMEKENPEIYDYIVPTKLKELYAAKDFGRYAQNGDIPVCFIANNHTTGGNSGSPVLNADGQLIGINFDRAWEGVMSDMQYSPEICRNISIDIRYALFIIEKLAGAHNLIDEMTFAD
ncbi:MAG: S46 family peptidase [Culturomica sp.]|jgi:hypothetical protein|nr:S46 family peptidase [Culturomica sp.]